jgi:type VI secretion system protein ImpK
MGMETTQTERTVLLNRDQTGQGKEALTDAASAPRFEQLEDRMVYAARLHSGEAFSVSMNVLVSAAADLLSSVIRLKTGDAMQGMEGLNTRLCESMRMFDIAALQKGAEASQVQAARYVLCTVVDEAVVTSGWEGRAEWAKVSLLSQFHGETSGGEKFFHLLDRVVQSPEKYRPLLELMYICISLGFEGKYRLRPRGAIELEAIRDSVYRQIVKLQGEIPRELSPHWQGLADGRRSLVRIVPGWLVMIFLLISLAGLYGGFAWVLGEQREAVLKPFQSNQQTSASPQS